MNRGSDHYNILVVGSGPTGLGAAYRMRELGFSDFCVLEANPHSGGLSSSFSDDLGFTWDIGVHIVFSRSEYYKSFFRSILVDDYLTHNRSTWIRSSDNWVPYPFQYNLRHLPKDKCFECVLGLIKAQRSPTTGNFDSFEDFVSSTFGEGIARHFMRPYNEKVWASRLSDMSCDWVSERVASVDIESVLRSVICEEDFIDWGPNRQFMYPLRGGSGEPFRRLATSLGEHIRLNHRVVEIDTRRKIVHLSNEQALGYDHLISTAPLDLLVTHLLSDLPSQAKTLASSLRHTSGFVVGIGVEAPCTSDWSWAYFPGKECPFYRATLLSNLSPHMTPNPKSYHSIICEITSTGAQRVDQNKLINDTIAGLLATGLLPEGDQRLIRSTWIQPLEYAYPVPTLNRNEVLSRVVPLLEEIGVFSRGRFGMWCYEIANTDHSFLQGVEIVDRLLLGRQESLVRQIEGLKGIFGS